MSPLHVKLELIARHLATIGALVTVEREDRGDIVIVDTKMILTMKDAVANQDREMSVDSTDLTVETAIATGGSRSIAMIAKTMSYPLRRRPRRSTAAGQGRRTAFWREKRSGSSPSGGQRRRHVGNKRRPIAGTNDSADGVVTAYVE